jgi:hypothetical protein
MPVIVPYAYERCGVLMAHSIKLRAMRFVHASLMRYCVFQEVKSMTLSIATLKAMIHEYHGFPLSDEELDRIRPELDTYLAEAEQLRELELANVLSARLLHVDEGGQA